MFLVVILEQPPAPPAAVRFYKQYFPLSPLLKCLKPLLSLYEMVNRIYPCFAPAVHNERLY